MSAMVKVIAPDLDLPADYEIAVDARDELEIRARALLADLADSQWPRLEKTLARFQKAQCLQSAGRPMKPCRRKLIDLFHLNLRQGITIGRHCREELEAAVSIPSG